MDTDGPLDEPYRGAAPWIPLPLPGALSGHAAIALALSHPCRIPGTGLPPPDQFNLHRKHWLDEGWLTEDFSCLPRLLGGQGGWRYYTIACVTVGFLPDPSGREWTCPHGSEASLHRCEICDKEAAHLWWHLYSEAWHHFRVSAPLPTDAECIAWLDDQEIGEIDSPWPLA